MRKTFLFAAILLVASMLRAQVPQQVDGIWYLLNDEDQTATVTFEPNEAGFVTGATYAGRLIIPETIWAESGEYRVTAIGDSAFAFCDNLTGIHIPASVQTLGLGLTWATVNVTELVIEDGTDPIYFTYEQGNSGEEISFYELSASCTYLYIGRNVEEQSSLEYTSPVFHSWQGVQDVVFGEFVTEIPDAFCMWSRGLRSVQINTPTPLAAGQGMFMFLNEESANPKAITLYVQEGLSARYAKMDIWQTLTIEEMDIERQYGIKWVDSSFDFEVNGLFYKETTGTDGVICAEVVMPQVWYLYPDGSYVSTWSSEFPYKQREINIPEEVAVYDPQTEVSTHYPVIGIGDFAFRGASNLETLTIPTSVTYVGTEIVEYTDKLRHLDIPESIVSVGWLAFARAGFEEIVIPASSSNWVDNNAAFQDCPNLQKATFAKGTTAIQDRIFFGCTALRVINIPDEVKSIGAGAFAGCEALTELHLPASLEVITDRLFRGCPIRALEIPAGVIEIAPAAFLGTNITKLTVNPDNGAFDSRDNCNAIIRKADNTIVAAAAGAFIPESVEGIAAEAFDELYGLRSVTLPKGLKKIETDAFMNCENLSIITSLIENPAGVLEENGFDSWYENNPLEVATLYVPAGTLAAYQADAEWGKFQHIVEMADTHKPASVEDLMPVEQTGAADFDNIPADLDLTNAVIDNIYVTADTTNNDRYDAAEKAFVFETVVDELMMENVLANVGNMDIIRNNFSGLIIEIPAGEGTIKVTIKTSGNRKVAVHIEGLDPTLFDKATKDEIELPYNIVKDALVYIYPVIDEGALAPAPKKVHSIRRATAEETKNEVHIYGAAWEVKKVISAIDEIDSSDTHPVKLINQGQLYIIRDGEMYNVQGVRVQ